MRLSHALESVGAIALGLGFVRFRATSQEYAELCRTRVDQAIDGIDVFLAGVAIVFGTGVIVERIRAGTRRRWDAGRWVWFLAAVFVGVGILNHIVDTVSYQFVATYVQTSLAANVISGLRGKYTGFLLPSFGWMLIVLMAGRLCAPRCTEIAAPDWCERSGRAFAGAVVAALLVLKCVLLFGCNQSGMGGALAGG